jgi:peptidoglycan/LPS O-acetylase OafA/YrhL
MAADSRPATDAAQSGAGGRLAFADLLRGIAAFIVMVGHFTILYLTAPAVVALLTNSEPAAAGYVPEFIKTLYDRVDLAATGVAVFFLISGFVIPLSLERATTVAFIIRRFLRIYPTFWVALALNVAALFLSAWYWSKPVEHTLGDYVANAALTTELSARHFDIPSVMWTLQIEMKYYLLAPLFFFAIRRDKVFALLAWGVGVVGLYWLALAGCDGDTATCWGRRGPVVYVAWEAMYLTYMLIGSVIYAHYRQRVSAPVTLGLVAALFGCFLVSFHLSPLVGAAQHTLMAYVWGFMIFGAFYLFRDRIVLRQPFRFLADISYPLYVVHPLVGYACIRLLTVAGVPYLAALAIAVALVMGLATLIHRWVEKPSIELGARIAKRLRKPKGVFATVPVAAAPAPDADEAGAVPGVTASA